MLKKLETLQKRYGWMNDADSIKLAFKLMGRVLEDSTLDTWEDRVAALCSSQMNTQLGYNKAKGEIIQKVLRTSAYNDQVRYLDKTKKPREMTCQIWIDWILTINKCLSMMKKNGQQFLDKKIIADVITPNLPGVLAVDFMKEGGDNLTDIKDAIKVLKQLEKADR
eukprot:8126018-Ditylum_brightwellii.AAC.1